MKRSNLLIFSVFSMAAVIAVGCGDSGKSSRRTPIRNGSAKAEPGHGKPQGTASDTLIEQTAQELDKILKDSVGEDQVVDLTSLNETVHLKLVSVAHVLKNSEGAQNKQFLFQFTPSIDEATQNVKATSVVTRRTANAKTHSQKMNRYFIPSDLTLTANEFTSTEGFFYTPNIDKGSAQIAVERGARSNKSEEDILADILAADRKEFKKGSLIKKGGKYSITVTRNGMRWMIKVDRQAEQGKANLFQELVLFYDQVDKATPEKVAAEKVAAEKAAAEKEALEKAAEKPATPASDKSPAPANISDGKAETAPAAGAAEAKEPAAKASGPKAAEAKPDSKVAMVAKSRKGETIRSSTAKADESASGQQNSSRPEANSKTEELFFDP